MIQMKTCVLARKWHVLFISQVIKTWFSNLMTSKCTFYWNSVVGKGKHSKSFLPTNCLSTTTDNCQPLHYTFGIHSRSNTPFKYHTHLLAFISVGVVAFTGQWYYSPYCPIQVHGLKASSLESSMNFQRLTATLYFSVLVDSPTTLRRTTLIRVTVFVFWFSDSIRSKVSPTLTWTKDKIGVMRNEVKDTSRKTENAGWDYVTCNGK